MFNTKLIGTCISAGEEPETAEQKPELCENAPAGGETVGEELKLVPSSVGQSASAVTLEGSNSALATNTRSERDTLVRPLNDGAVVYSIMRSSQAPTQTSWTLPLTGGEHLEAVDAHHLELFDASGHAILTMVAEPASDATGQVVPTKMSIIGGNELVFEVEAPANAVFPIVAGVGFEGGSLHVHGEGPKTVAELRREEERVKQEIKELEQMEKESRKVTHGPNYKNSFSTLLISRLGPPMFSKGESSADHEFEFSHCNYGEILPEIYRPGTEPEDKKYGSEKEQRGFTSRVGNCIKENHGEPVIDGEVIRGTAHDIEGHEVWFTEADRKRLKCHKSGPGKPAMVHCYVKPEHSTSAITVGGNYRYASVASESQCMTVYAHLNTFIPHIEVKEPDYSWAGAQGKGVEPEYCQWPQQEN